MKGAAPPDGPTHIWHKTTDHHRLEEKKKRRMMAFRSHAKIGPKADIWSCHHFHMHARPPAPSHTHGVAFKQFCNAAGATREESRALIIIHSAVHLNAAWSSIRSISRFFPTL